MPELEGWHFLIPLALVGAYHLVKTIIEGLTTTTERDREDIP